MDDETKKKLRDQALARRGTLLKDLTETDLLIACDHWEESGGLREEWTKIKDAFVVGTLSNCYYKELFACYLVWAKDYQVKALAWRLPSRKILLPTKLTSYGGSFYAYTDRGRRIPIKGKGLQADNRSRICRPVVVFPLEAIKHILEFLHVKEYQKYIRHLHADLSEYETIPDPNNKDKLY